MSPPNLGDLVQRVGTKPPVGGGGGRAPFSHCLASAAVSPVSQQRRASCVNNLEDASGILHFKSGSEAHEAHYT
eukprot:7255369-Pyramimonas_sp.AAC.1